MPRPQHEQANPEVQEFFKEIVVEQIDAIAAAHPEEEVHTYFQDEARFGQKGTIIPSPDCVLLFHGLCRLGKIDWASESHQELDRCLSRAITASKNFND